MSKIRLLVGMAIVLMACAFVASKSATCPDKDNDAAQGGGGTYSKRIEAEIKQVENSLSGPVKFEGISGDNLLDHMALYKVKGLSIAVVKDYKVIWSKGYGWANENENQPVTDKTMFMAASVSKSINSMGVMKLVQDKKLDLTKDINDYLVSWKFPYDRVSQGKKITTLNLLTHTGGINNSAPSYIDKDTIPTILQVLNGTRESQYVYSDPKAARSIMEPNRQFEYSNTGVGITQVIVSDITQKTYEQYMQESVFQPLGMNNSCYTEASLKTHQGQVAVGYTNGYEVPGKHVIIPFQAAGGLWTTPTDLARFITEIQLSQMGKSNNLLSQETIKTMLTPYFQGAPGFFLREMNHGGQKYFSHSGVITGFASEYYGSFEGGYGVAVMINSDGNSGTIIPEVINSVATVYKWKDFYEPKVIKQKPIAVPDELLTRCEGVYLAGEEYLVISKKSDGDYCWTQGKDNKMYFLSEQSLLDVESSSTFMLIMDDAGQVASIKRMFNGKEFGTFIKVTNVDSAKFSSGQLIEISWHLLENKKFDQAASYFISLLARDPQDLMAKCNLAHCYLFAKKYTLAMQLYQENLNAEIDNAHTFKQTMINDFVFFKRNGFDTALMDKVFVDLKLEVPRVYQN